MYEHLHQRLGCCYWGGTPLPRRARHILAPGAEAPECAAPDEADADIAFLEDLAMQIECLGYCNFASIPLIYALFFCRWYATLAVGVAGKALWGMALQRGILGRIVSWMQETDENRRQRQQGCDRGNPACYLATAQHLFSPVCAWLPITWWGVVAMRSVTEYVDPDLDAVTSAMAWHQRHGSVHTFNVAWQAVPLVGGAVASIGLPGLLTFFVVAPSVLQLWSFGAMLRRLRSQLIPAWPPCDDVSSSACSKRFSFWSHFQHACDASSLMLLAEAANSFAKEDAAAKVEACHAEGTDPGYTFAGRSIAFKTKILAEVTPSLWFAISLLSYTYGTAPSIQIATMLFSIATSCLSTGKAVLVELQGCVATVRVGWIWRGYGDSLALGAVFRTTLVSLVVAVSLINVARLAGVWYCHSHVLNISTGCLDLPSVRHHPS